MRRALFLCLFVSLAACSQQNEKGLNGYVEGEYVYIAPTSGGILSSLLVKRGDAVKEGETLFALDDVDLRSALEAVKAEKLQAEANYNDLTKGQRPEEIAVIRKQKEQAQATLENAEKEYNRTKPLLAKGGVSKSIFNERKAAFDVARARVQELSAQLVTATLGARSDQIDAAKAVIERMDQHIIQQEKRLNEIAPKAPANGRVEDTYYRVGEFVAAGTPVVSLLPPENVKIRFFVPQATLPQFQMGNPIIINCDGCEKGIAAKISYIASQAEFTPPVIYSIGSRDKLVFMVEATPDHFDPALRPGLPVNIILTDK